MRKAQAEKLQDGDVVYRKPPKRAWGSRFPLAEEVVCRKGENGSVLQDKSYYGSNGIRVVQKWSYGGEETSRTETLSRFMTKEEGEAFNADVTERKEAQDARQAEAREETRKQQAKENAEWDATRDAVEELEKALGAKGLESYNRDGSKLTIEGKALEAFKAMLTTNERE